VHGFAAPIGGMFAAPHGAVCAALLSHVMEINLRALRERDTHSTALSRYEEVARLVTGDRNIDADLGVAWVRELCTALRIPSLRSYGISEGDVPLLCEKAASASSMKGNPLPLTEEELRDILLTAL
jgi:alcohol dehydrogenase class IV